MIKKDKKEIYKALEIVEKLRAGLLEFFEPRTSLCALTMKVNTEAREIDIDLLRAVTALDSAREKILLAQYVTKKGA